MKCFIDGRLFTGVRSLKSKYGDLSQTIVDLTTRGRLPVGRPNPYIMFAAVPRS